MKIYTNRPRDNWISPYTVLEKLFWWRKDYDAFHKQPPAWISKGCQLWFKVANVLNPDINYIHIDRHDVWNMADTLAEIILPMLVELKRQKQGSGFIDDEDVPYGLRSFNAPPKENEWDTDDFLHLRYSWFLDELIWTFTALHPSTDYEDNYHYGTVDFLWQDVPDKPGFTTLVTSPRNNHRWDKAGYEVYQARVNNGLRLFGKYYCALWD